MLLSGSGSKLTDRRDEDEAENRSLFEITCYGFVMVEASQEALRFLYVVTPSGEDSECEGQEEPWKIAHTRVVEHYDPN